MIPAKNDAIALSLSGSGSNKAHYFIVLGQIKQVLIALRNKLFMFVCHCRNLHVDVAARVWLGFLLVFINMRVVFLGRNSSANEGQRRWIK